MKKKTILITALMLTAVCATQAQIIEQVGVMEENVSRDDKDEMDFPDVMEGEQDSLMNLYTSRTYLSKDNDCNMKDENPSFSDEVYKERLSRIPSVIEMPYNDAVRKCIDRYTVRLRKSVSYMLGAANLYMPIFEEALEAYQLPLELKYLPVIESALNPTIVSRTGATGLWQFMIGTAKLYGLEINSLVDERRDPVKSTYAAVRHLRDLYELFGDWNLALAAYNCGPENVNKALRRAGGENRDYWYISRYLPRETQGYVPAFIAANYVMNYYCEHNICPMTINLPEKTDTIVINRKMTLQQIASALKLEIDMLRSLNPELRRDIAPGNSMPIAIRLPQTEINHFIDLQETIFNDNKNEQMAQRQDAEANANKEKVEDVEEAQEDEKVEKKKRSSRSERTSRRNTRRNTRHSASNDRQEKSQGDSGTSPKYVTIRRGDNLGAIAKRNHTTINKLQELNGLNGSTKITAGKSIRVR